MSGLFIHFTITLSLTCDCCVQTCETLMVLPGDFDAAAVM